MSDPDRRVVALALDGRARVLFAEVTEIANEVVRRHDLKARARWIGSELVVANVLLGAWIKGDERLQLQLQSESPACAFAGEVSADGRFRGRFAPPRIGQGTDAINGVMLAIKSNLKEEMYRGVTAVKDETVASALDRHLKESGQVPASVRIDVKVGDDGVERAIGMVVERVPGGDEADDARFSAWSAAMLTLPVEDLITQFGSETVIDEPLDVLELWPLVFACRCSRPKVEGMLLSLGATVLREMRDEDHQAEITCHFCNEVYAFTEAELDQLLGQLEADA